MPVVLAGGTLRALPTLLPFSFLPSRLLASTQLCARRLGPLECHCMLRWIEAPMRQARSSPHAHRGARVIGTDALRLVLILREPSDGQERKQDSEDDPNINARIEQLSAALPANISLTDRPISTTW